MESAMPNGVKAWIVLAVVVVVGYVAYKRFA